MFTYADVPHRKARLDARARQRSEARSKPTTRPTKRLQSIPCHGMTFGQARSVYGALKPKPMLAPVVTSVAVPTLAVASAAVPSAVSTVPKAVVPTVLLLAPGPRPAALLPASVPTAVTVPAFDRQAAAAPLAAAARTKEQQLAWERAEACSNVGKDMPKSKWESQAAKVEKEAALIVKIPKSDDCLQHDAAPVAPTPVITGPAPRFWAGRSDTPGLSDTIDTKRSAEILAAARINHPDWLTDGSRVRRNGVTA